MISEKCHQKKFNDDIIINFNPTIRIYSFNQIKRLVFFGLDCFIVIFLIYLFYFLILGWLKIKFYNFIYLFLLCYLDIMTWVINLTSEPELTHIIFFVFLI
jgi:hypothetical protein